MKTTTKIAVENLKYNKSRSILIGISIFLSSLLLAVTFFVGVGLFRYSSENMNTLYGNYHAQYLGVNEAQLNIISHHADVETYGIGTSIANVEDRKIKASLTYMDEKAALLSNISLESGLMPVNENDIVAPKEFFANYIGSPSIGNKIKVPYRINGLGDILTKEFTISGFLPSSEIPTQNRSYMAIVSLEFLKESIPAEARTFSTLIKMTTAKNETSTDLENRINKLAEAANIVENRISMNKALISMSTTPSTEILFVIGGIALIVILFSALVLSNIFQVGIVQKIQEYGKLRALGITKKQLKRTLLTEGFILSCVTIPFGILIGYLASELGINFIIEKFASMGTTPEELSLSSCFSLPVMFLIIAVTLITVYISLRKPMKKASKASPIEAIKFMENSTTKVQNRKGYHEVTFSRLVRSNLSRNKKRTITTILTLGLSCVMFITVANVLSSTRIEDIARNAIPKGDFILSLDYSLTEITYPEKNLNRLQLNTPISDTLLEKIKAMDGVTKVETQQTILSKIIPASDTDSGLFDDNMSGIQALAKEDFEKLAEDLELGDINYEKAVAENGVVFTFSHFFEGLGFKVGDKIDFILYDGTKEIPFTATLLASTKTAYYTTFVMTEDTLKKLAPTTNLLERVYIYCDSKAEAALSNELRNLADTESYFRLTSLQEQLSSARGSTAITTYPLYALFIILGVIAFMNLANTLITSTIIRKRELGILQAIGLTNKQLTRMFQAEGLVYTIGTLLIALIVGNGLGYLAFLYAKETGFLSVTTYHFPIVEAAAMTIILVALQFILSLVLTKNMQKESLIERIKHQD